jgi:DNA-binding NarL/FixJ family response regulator
MAGGRRHRVFLVDQFPVSRLAVSEWLKETPDLTVCGEADGPTRALAAVADLKPDVVVTEILRQQDLGFVQSLRERHPGLPILVFSFRDEEWYAPRALAAGADGYLMKGVSKDGLLEGIRGALAGRVVLSLEMRARMLRKCFGAYRAAMPVGKSLRRHCSPTDRGRI